MKKLFCQSDEILPILVTLMRRHQLDFLLQGREGVCFWYKKFWMGRRRRRCLNKQKKILDERTKEREWNDFWSSCAVEKNRFIVVDKERTSVTRWLENLLQYLTSYNNELLPSIIKMAKVGSTFFQMTNKP